MIDADSVVGWAFGPRTPDSTHVLGGAALAHRLPFVSSYAISLSSFFRFVVLVT
jgi:hypothetical protein